MDIPGVSEKEKVIPVPCLCPTPQQFKCTANKHDAHHEIKRFADIYHLGAAIDMIVIKRLKELDDVNNADLDWHSKNKSTYDRINDLLSTNCVREWPR